VFQLNSAITSHFGETLVRMRFTEYVARFVRLASRYEEVAAGSTNLGYTSTPFVDGSLGSGIVFPDEAVAFKELTANASRIEGWRRSKSYQYCVQVCGSVAALENVLINCGHVRRISKNTVQLLPYKDSTYCINCRDCGW